MISPPTIRVLFYILNTNLPISSVTIEPVTTVVELAALIRDNTNFYPPGTSAIYKPPADWIYFDEQELEMQARPLLHGFKKLQAARTVQSYFGDTPGPYFVIVENCAPPPTRREDAILAGRERPLNSAGMRLATIIETQKITRPDAIFNCRPFSLRQPRIEIWCSAFAELKRILSLSPAEVNFTPVELDEAFGFMVASLDLYKLEVRRQFALRNQTFAGINMFMGGKIPVGDGYIEPDGCIFTSCHLKVPAVSCIQELKNEIGEDGSDPMRQAECDYVALCSSKEYKAVSDRCCCPALLISMAGSHLMISGAVFTDAFICEPLVNMFVGPITTATNPTQSDLHTGIRQVALVSRAVSVCIAKLADFYVSLPAKSISGSPGLMCTPCTPHFKKFPFAGGSIELEYIERLETYDTPKSVFKARLKDTSSTSVVVKFTPTYNKQAHELLGEAMLAPKLWFCERVPEVGGLYVVVMEYVKVDPTHALANDLNPAAIKSLRNTVHLLHNANLVHGDVRDPNVLVTQDGAMLIDFDWCGEEGRARYPYDISLDGISWHKGVVPGGEIKKEHDMFMLSNLTGDELYVGHGEASDT
ncbi:hypothetical protein BDY19DRAFT_995585 [Irpex rosettiformis]|uniref:Uncharacterized protein n=1 Tax=Irpex rosettiformis TaxID=378272 RepID=A0ACB8TY14_9APHY|nr:hypothetical protein BDY19DRAFT_995585 [Irpex rosettiformis]